MASEPGGKRRELAEGAESQLEGLEASWERLEASWEGLGNSWEGPRVNWETRGGGDGERNEKREYLVFGGIIGPLPLLGRCTMV